MCLNRSGTFFLNALHCRSRRNSRAGMEEVEIDLGDEQQASQQPSPHAHSQQQSDLHTVDEHEDLDAEGDAQGVCVAVLVQVGCNRFVTYVQCICD